MKKVCFSVLLMGVAMMAFAEESFYTGRSPAVIKGYDVVAYFNQGRAVKGQKDFSYDYKGVQWFFSSPENRDAFAASPDKYVPQYGGYCAYAMSEYGDKVKIDPNQFTIKDGKLYLNYNRRISDRFNADIDNHIVQADANWKKILAE